MHAKGNLDCPLLFPLLLVKPHIIGDDSYTHAIIRWTLVQNDRQHLVENHASLKPKYRYYNIQDNTVHCNMRKPMNNIWCKALMLGILLIIIIIRCYNNNNNIIIIIITTIKFILCEMIFLKFIESGGTKKCDVHY